MSLDKVLSDLQKTFGKESVGSAKELIKAKGAYSTGSIQLDARLGGGFPKGRLTELYGPESSGKTTACIHAIADAQAKGDKAVFVDLEGTFDKYYARSLGVNLDDLIYIPPTNGEEAISIAEKVCKSGEIGIIVFDSIASLLPIKQEQGDVGNANMAYHAKLTGEFCKRFVPIQYRHSIAVIAINQIREKPGVSFGNPEYTTGGNALKFYAAVRIDIRKSGSVHKDKEGNVIGEPRKVKIVKSKINDSANKIMMVDIIYGEGIDQIGEVIDVGVEVGLIEKSGSWYSYDGTKIAQGRESAKQFFRDNEELYEQVRQKIVEGLTIDLYADENEEGAE